MTPSARALVVLTVALVLAPLALPPFFLQLLTEIAIVGLFATAFNLLMGRCWPPLEGDLREAQEICGELGLGELLRRMPAGLMLPGRPDSGPGITPDERSLIQCFDLRVRNQHL